METFVAYFLFWFYFALVLLGVAMSTGCACLGGVFAYYNYVDEKHPDWMDIAACICVSIVGFCSVAGCFAMSKFVLNPIYKSLPNLF